MIPLPFGTTSKAIILKQVLIIIAGQRVSVCDRCVLAVKLTIDPTLIKCAVKLMLFFQFS